MDRIKTYIDTLFEGVGESQELYEVKLELTSNLRARVAELKARGNHEEAAFKEAIVSLGDLSLLIEEMHIIGQKKNISSLQKTMAAKISVGSIVLGSVTLLFGILIGLMLSFENSLTVAPAIFGAAMPFCVSGLSLMTYGSLTLETQQKFAMHKIRAGLYTLSVALFSFSFFAAMLAYLSENKPFVGIATLIPFLIPAVGLLVYLTITETSRKKLVG